MSMDIEHTDNSPFNTSLAEEQDHCLTFCESCKVKESELLERQGKLTTLQAKLSINQSQWICTIKSIENPITNCEEQGEAELINKIDTWVPITDNLEEDKSGVKSEDKIVEELMEDMEAYTTDPNENENDSDAGDPIMEA
ncbi:Hypothetical predicted protein [Paramuricea clavata]|uniref:Uncharacterized protein n=1 Tax=Paramuricea clavata TaxID=317549 RepID=A0A7D9IKA4_PARCT|nr:Hypothetical predicted protein [Paramuricea clavata]